jgi:hypothetical protein
MCKLTESNKSDDAEVNKEQEPELRHIWAQLGGSKVYGTIDIITTYYVTYIMLCYYHILLPWCNLPLDVT